MNRLLASLLVLPFLLGANVPVAAPGDQVASAEETLAAFEQPSLAGGLPALWSAASSALPHAGAVDSWRTATRTHRTHGERATRPRATAVHTHIATHQRGRLAFGHELACSQRNVPATFGNPPPASPT